MGFDPIVVISFLLVAFFLFRFIRRNRREQEETFCPKSKKMPVAVREQQDGEGQEEEDCGPNIIDLGKWGFYPKCPHCSALIKKIVVVWNEKDADWKAESFNLVMCPRCRKVIPATYRADV